MRDGLSSTYRMDTGVVPGVDSCLFCEFYTPAYAALVLRPISLRYWLGESYIQGEWEFP